MSAAELDTEQWNSSETALPRTFGLFFNQNRSTTLRDAAVREALELAIDRDVLIERALNGAGIPSPNAISITKSTIESQEASTNTIVPTSTVDRIAAARSLLEDADWTQTEQGMWEKEDDDSTVPLAVTIRTANTADLDAVLTYIAGTWRELGVSVQTEQYEQTDLVQSVIRPRDFSILLFGLDTSRSQDLYPFWHSSQQDDPGLNIAQYTNLSVDELLSTARTATEESDRIAALIAASDIINEERPAIFLFQPTSLYVTKNTIATERVASIGRAADRFSTIANWHTDTSALWPIFRNEAEAN
jgi:peptide/nickel transport system substrate-binding protein